MTSLNISVDASVNIWVTTRLSINEVSVDAQPIYQLAAHLLALMVSVDVSTRILLVVYW